MSIPISDGMTPKDHSRHAEANGWVGNSVSFLKARAHETPGYPLFLMGEF